MSDDVLRMTFEIQQWVRDQMGVKEIVAAKLQLTGYGTLSRLAAEKPEVIYDLHEACKTMIEELPWV